jgi:DNA mismatch repair protein MSH5
MLILPLLDSIFGSFVLDSRPSVEFQFDAAKNKLINLDIALEHGPDIMFTTPGDDFINNDAYRQGHNDSGVGRKGKLMRLAGWLDLDSRLTVRGLIDSHQIANSVLGRLCRRCLDLSLTSEKCRIPTWR